MTKPFTPSLQNFQKDIERYLKSQGKCEKNEHGQIVFRGYPDALALMYRTYLDKGALTPLVEHFRKWNWEWNYDDHLIELTARLQKDRNWPLLKKLWAGVIAKRRTHYNQTRKAQQAHPQTIPEASVTKTKELLLDALGQLQSFATELQQQSDIEEYVEMIARVEKRHKA